MRYPVPALLVLALAAACEPPVRTTAPARPRPDLRPTAAVAPTESEADAISQNVQSLHLVGEFRFPTIVDPRFGSADPASAEYATVVGYAHAGDAAIWTGHYLAAESFRFAVTRSPDALRNAERALEGIRGLVDVTADAMPQNPGLLARFLWPEAWWYSDRMVAEEGGHGVYRGTPGGVPHLWLGNTSRDQYSGVFFGLAVAYDAFGLADDSGVRTRARTRIRGLVTRMLNFLIRNGWNVPMPDGSYSTTFLQRPDQQLALLQVGRYVNPRRFATIYEAQRASQAATVGAPIMVECGDPHGSYYKFNLNHINLYTLIRLEEADSPFRGFYMNAFATLRGCTGGRQPGQPDHQNAHFNMIERGLEGPNDVRDTQTRDYLALWLERPRRELWVDLREAGYVTCEPPDRACEVIPINERVPTDFLWQRSPFLLYSDHPGHDTVGLAGIDYLLPYWMGRYYGVTEP